MQLGQRINKMQWFYADPLTKVERTRKHQMYKQMLDQQMRLKQEYHAFQQQNKKKHFIETDLAPIIQLQSQAIINKQHHHIFSYHPTKAKHFDQTEKCIQTCEDMISQLNRLKQESSASKNTRLYQSRQVVRNTQLAPLRWQTDYYRHNHNFCASCPARESKNSSKIETTSSRRRRKALPQRRRPIDTQNQSTVKVHTKTEPSVSQETYHHIYSQSENKSRKKILSGRKVPDSERDQANKIHNEIVHLKEGLSECIVELTKYLRKKQENQQSNNKIEQSILVEEQETQSQSQDIIKQQNKEDRNIYELKLKTIMKLRSIKEKSREFMHLVEGKGQLSNPEEREQNTIHMPQLYQNNYHGNFERSNKKQAMMVSNQAIDASTINEQVFDRVLNYLSGYNTKLTQLTACLSELSQILKHQNRQINSLNTSRANRNHRIITDPTHEPLIQSVNKEDGFEEQQVTSLSGIQLGSHELKQTFLVCLRKVRVRGQLLADKVARFKKMHTVNDSSSNVFC